MVPQIRAGYDIDWGNSLLHDGTKPLPEQMLTYHQKTPVKFTLEQIYEII